MISPLAPVRSPRTAATATSASPTVPASPAVPVSPTVSTQWLCDHLGADDLLVLDASVFDDGGSGPASPWTSGRSEHLRLRLPGSRFADLLGEFSDPEGPHPFTRPSASQFEAATARLGIGSATTVVVYDSGFGHCAARLWWLFRSFGFDRVSVLDGGLTKWLLEQRPTEGSADATATAPSTSAAAFHAVEQPHFWVDKPFVEAVVDGRTDALLLSAVPQSDFTGASGRLARRGHIPGSLNVPSLSVVDPETHALLRRDLLARTFAPVLTEAHDGRIVAYCGAGVSAATDVLALAVLGHTEVSLYDGSLSEWVADPSAPLVVDAAA